MASPPLELAPDVLALVRSALADREAARGPETDAPDSPGTEREIPTSGRVELAPLSDDGWERFCCMSVPVQVVHRAVSLGDTSKRTLFAHHVWNGARAAARALDERPELARGKAVVELGAGSGLPALVAAALGARFVAMTDYPSPELVATMQANLTRNGVSSERGLATGFLWGSDPAALLDASGASRPGYELVVAADCLWNHPLHGVLVASIAALLARSASARALVSFSHHIPGPESAARDLAFFSEATNAGLAHQPMAKYTFAPIMPEPGVETQTVFCVALCWAHL